MTTKNSTTNQEPTEEEKLRMQFDEKACDILREACHSTFLAVPEVRSIVVTFDYFRNLNDMPNISKGLWLHTDGGKDKPADAVVGSLGAVLQSAAHILDEQMKLYMMLSTQITELSKQLLEKQNELKKQQEGGTS